MDELKKIIITWVLGLFSVGIQFAEPGDIDEMFEHQRDLMTEVQQLQLELLINSLRLDSQIKTIACLVTILILCLIHGPTLMKRALQVGEWVEKTRLGCFISRAVRSVAPVWRGIATCCSRFWSVVAPFLREVLLLLLLALLSPVIGPCWVLFKLLAWCFPLWVDQLQHRYQWLRFTWLERWIQRLRPRIRQ